MAGEALTAHHVVKIKTEIITNQLITNKNMNKREKDDEEEIYLSHLFISNCSGYNNQKL